MDLGNSQSATPASESNSNPLRSDAATNPLDLFVVALGASAGGLEALEKFFDNMPADVGLAFVVVQHLSPDFKSLMNELLARHTKLTIHRVTDGIAIEPNSIYLIPPKKEMIVSEGKLLLTDKDPSQGLSLPIDTFLRSLATEYGRNAIAVILSGTGSDGSRGIRAIHEAGGLVIAQDEATANFDGMPRAAIDTGVVDVILPPSEMGSAIIDFMRGSPIEVVGADNFDPALADDGVREIFRLLHTSYGIDFSFYKPNTVARRVERRLQLSRVFDLGEYIQKLRADGEELNSLYKDLLIGVTRFFRDDGAFEQLEHEVIPQLLNRLPKDEELRVWVTGCATGEEAYSIAILIHEAMTARDKAPRVKIFATDVHQSSLEFASAGIYSEISLKGVSHPRLARYFARRGANYQVLPELRKLIVFAPHNVIKDAPFTKLDLVSCRNMLIYLQPHAQKKAISLFHFGLKPNGFLFLGPSESPGELTDEFDSIDRHWKIFRKRRDVRLATDFRLPMSPGLGRWRASAGIPITDSRGLPDVQLLRAYDVLLNQYVPPSLLVNDRRELIHAFAGAGKFLSVRDGRPTADILELVEPELRIALAGAIQRATKEKQPIVYGSVSLNALPDDEQLRLSVQPFTIQSTGEEYFLIAFESQSKRPTPKIAAADIDYEQAYGDRLAEVEDELRYTKENLQATIEEMETTNEELQATNEELVASNEELQSTNEELHSVNEELYTVNAEHQRKITELTELTDDMDNLLRSTEIGTIFLDRSLRIRKFTPQIYHAFQILPQDIGRSIETFAHNIAHEGLLAEVQKVVDTEQPFERDVQDHNGKWFLLRVLPYRSRGQVDGAVLTLVDIGGIKQTEDRLRRMSKVFMDGADPVIIEDLDGRIIDLNEEAVRAYGWSRKEMLGQPFSKFVPAEYVAHAESLRQRCRSGEPVRNVELVRQDRAGNDIPVLMTLSVLQNEQGRPIGIASLSKDILEQKKAERQARNAVIRRDEFLAMLSHELRNPLGAVLNAAELMSRIHLADASVASATEVVLRQSRQMSRLLDDLLDVSRVTQGKIEIRRRVLDLTQLIGDAIDAVRPEIEELRHELILNLPLEPLYIEGDPARILQIQENLLANAAKYTPAGGRIVVSAWQEHGQAIVSVQDNGQGIPPDMLTAIFELFVQGTKTLARTEGGMGIGLSLARVLVELHGGTLSVHSDGKNCGSTFTMRLPLTEKRPNVSSQDSAPRELTMRVLIIEDNEDSRGMLAKLLQLYGCEVSTAHDGLTGFDAINRLRPDVALVDIGLPGMDGYEIAQRVRSQLKGISTRLIAVTGYGRAEDRAAILAAGFDTHVVKPINPDELMRIIATKGDGAVHSSP